MGLKEKQKIEQNAANLFLSIYNSKFGTDYKIIELSDTPDITCKSQSTDKLLYLEIGLLEDLEGEIAHNLGRGKQPKSPTTGTTVRSFYEDGYPNYRKVLEKKALSYYGEDTALVLAQTAPIWGPFEWLSLARRELSDILQKMHSNFGAGIWVICIDNSGALAKDTICRISEPFEN